MFKKLLALSALSLTVYSPVGAQAPEALINTLVNTGLTAGLNGATNQAFGGSSRVRTVRTNFRVRYAGSSNYASDKRFYGTLRSYKSKKADALVSNYVTFSGQIAAGGDLGVGITTLEEAKASSLRLEFPATDVYPAASCEAKAVRVRKERKSGIFRIAYSLDVRMKRDREGKEVVTARRGSCQGLVAGALQSVVPYHLLEHNIPATLLVNADSQFEVLVQKPVASK